MHSPAATSSTRRASASEPAVPSGQTLDERLAELLPGATASFTTTELPDDTLIIRYHTRKLLIYRVGTKRNDAGYDDGREEEWPDHNGVLARIHRAPGREYPGQLALEPSGDGTYLQTSNFIEPYCKTWIASYPLQNRDERLHIILQTGPGIWPDHVERIKRFILTDVTAKWPDVDKENR